MFNSFPNFIRLYFLALTSIFLCLASLASLMVGTEVLGAVIVHLLLTSPFLLLITRQTSFGVALYICIAAGISVATLFAFYLAPEVYNFNGHRPFGFGVLSAFQVSALLGLFFWLLLVIDFVIGLLRVMPKKRILKRKLSVFVNEPYNVLLPADSRQKNSILLLLLILTIPVKLWMFSNGVGMVGITPPELPFKLSGLLFYLFNWIIPWFIALLYVRSSRSSGIFLFVIITGIISGICSLSKAVLLFYFISPTILALYDKHWIRFGFSVIACSLGIAAILSARSLLFLVTDGEVLLNLSYQISTLLPILVTELNFSSEIFSVLVGVMDRIDGFQSLFLSSEFNPNAVSGEWQLFLRFLYAPWSEISTDSMHIEYLGYSLPAGFISVPSTITSQMLMTSNANLFFLVPFALVVVSTFRLLDYGIRVFAIKYNLPTSIYFGLLFGASMFYYLSPGTTPVYLGLIIVLLLALSPRFVLRKKIAELL